VLTVVRLLKQAALTEAALKGETRSTRNYRRRAKANHNEGTFAVGLQIVGSLSSICVNASPCM
jgi:hypothetical protein